MKRCMLVVVLLLAVGLTAQAGLTHRYSFNGNCNDSVGTAHGTLVKKTGITNSWTARPGQVYFGQGFSETTHKLSGDPNTFDSQGDYVDLPNGILDDAAGTDNSFSFEAWATWDCNSETGTSVLFYFGQVADGSLSVAAEGLAPNFSQSQEDDADTKLVVFSYYRGGNNEGGYFRWKKEGQPGMPGIFPSYTEFDVCRNQQSHVVCTYNYDTATSTFKASLYINGELVESKVTEPGDIKAWWTSPDKDINCWLGRSMWGNNFMMAGSISEFRVWDEALTADKVARNYAAGPDQFCDALPAADINNDCVVDLDDFAAIATDWLYTAVAYPKTNLTHRYSFDKVPADDTKITDSVGGKDGVLVKGTGNYYAWGDGYLELNNPWGIPSDSTAGSYVRLPGHLIQDPNFASTNKQATIEMFVKTDNWRWNGQYFYFGSGMTYSAFTSRWKTREELGLSSDDDQCNSFLMFQSCQESNPNQTAQLWWHQGGLGGYHQPQNIYIKPSMKDEDDASPNYVYVAATIEENRDDQPWDTKDRVTLYVGNDPCGVILAPYGGAYPHNPNIRPQHEGPGINTTWVEDPNYVAQGNRRIAGQTDGWEDLANYIGRSAFPNGKSMLDADVTEFRIWNKALTLAELQASYNAGPDDPLDCIDNSPANIAGNDCVVDVEDLQALATDWLTSGLSPNPTP